MPSLRWIGKGNIENHHNEAPYRLLRHDQKRSIGAQTNSNLIIEGDNLHAHKAILPYYAGQIKCIYIDPPYNKGAEVGWTYNDSVDSPRIRRWLGQAVGKENEDLTSHDKWLCMMYPRMKLLTEFLKPDGFLLVSLDETEIARFRLMMDEILPPKSFITTLIWKSRRNLDNRSLHNVSVDHEYVIAYRKGNARFRGAEKDRTKYSNPDNDPRGDWMSDNLVGLATKERRPNLHYDLENPETGIVYPSVPPKRMEVLSGHNGAAHTRKKKPVAKEKNRQALTQEVLGQTSVPLCRILLFHRLRKHQLRHRRSRKHNGWRTIHIPKPRSLIEALLEQTTIAGDIVMDSFAGTGTTAHAVFGLKGGDQCLFVMPNGMDMDAIKETIQYN